MWKSFIFMNLSNYDIQVYRKAPEKSHTNIANMYVKLKIEHLFNTESYDPSFFFR